MNGAKLLWIATLSGASMFPGAVVAQSVCQLCAQPQAAEKAPARPIKIDIDTELDFAAAAHTDIGSGTIVLDPRTGQRQFSGLVGLSGPALRGTVTITGEPFRRLTIDMPTIISLNSTMGAKADITDVRTNLSPDPMIGANGTLVFSFGGKLSVRDGAAGEFHGRIQIKADYQ
jgi:hypothetical protein